MEGHSSLESSIAISTNVNLVSVDALFGYTQDVFNLIALCAFEIFQARGSVHGHDREDWALAESELLTPVKFHLSESGEQLIARAEVPGFHRQEIKVSLEPRRMSINEKPSPPIHQREKPPIHVGTHRSCSTSSICLVRLIPRRPKRHSTTADSTL
jgi:Protein of unknown function (DUF2934)